MTFTPPRLSLPLDAVNQLLDHNNWTIYDPISDGPVNWRHVIAMRMRDVDVEPLIPLVHSTLAEMVQATNAQVQQDWPPTADNSTLFQFADWLAGWLEHFRHWFDPVRDLFEPLCVTQDSQLVDDILDMANGAVWLDYVLEVIDQFQAQRELMIRIDSDAPDVGERLFHRAPGQRDMRAFTLFAVQHYGKFRAEATFDTAPAPANPDIGINFDNLFDCRVWEAFDDAG